MAQWYVRRGDKVLGPYDTAQIKSFASAGKLKHSDELRKEPEDAWVQAGSVTGLFDGAEMGAFSPQEAAYDAPANPFAAPQADLGAVSAIDDDGIPYATFWQRWAASFVDGILLAIVNGVCQYLLARLSRPEEPGFGPVEVLGLAISFLLPFAYEVGLTGSSAQATLGKQLLGLKIARVDGGKIGYGKAAIRYIAKLPSYLILLIGYFWMLFDARKQTWHDKLAGTVVYKVR